MGGGFGGERSGREDDNVEFVVGGITVGTCRKGVFTEAVGGIVALPARWVTKSAEGTGVFELEGAGRETVTGWRSCNVVLDDEGFERFIFDCLRRERDVVGLDCNG